MVTCKKPPDRRHTLGYFQYKISVFMPAISGSTVTFVNFIKRCPAVWHKCLYYCQKCSNHWYSLGKLYNALELLYRYSIVIRTFK
jgi:hypothetical protein